MTKRTVVCLAPDGGGRLTTERMDAGIRAAAARTRMNLVYARTPAEAAEQSLSAGSSAAIVLTSSRSDCMQAALTLTDAGIHAVLCNMSLPFPGILTSHVLPDFAGMAYRLTAALFRGSPDRPVFVGWNPDSCHDALRLAGAEAACREAGVPLARIDYGGELAASSEALLHRQAEFGHILCANDFIARYLVDRLPPERLRAMASLGGTQRFADVLTADIDYEAVGAAAVSLCLQRMRGGIDAGVGICLPVRMEEAAAPRPDASEKQDIFWHDESVSVMERAARVLDAASPEDAAIIALLLENRTYERIAEQTFMSVRTVKNHLRKLWILAGCTGRKEFCALMRTVKNNPSERSEK